MPPTTVRFYFDAAHTFLNTGSETMESIATGDRFAYEVREYPDDGTVYVEALDKAREAWFRAGR